MKRKFCLLMIEYKGGATVKESYTYMLDANGGILTMAQADGAAWVYGYERQTN